MPALPNSRYERFVQALFIGKHQEALFIGKHQEDAYAEAGFSPNKGNASNLKNKPEIKNRLMELHEEKAAMLVQTSGKEALITRDSLLAELEEARQLAIEKKNPSAAVAATIGKARITGNIVDRREVGDVGAFDDLTDEELVALVAQKARALGIAGLRLFEDDNK